MPKKVWTSEMDQIIRSEYPTKGTMIFSKLGTTRDAVRSRARKLGVKGPSPKGWMRRFIYKKDEK